MPVDANLVLGADGSTKPDEQHGSVNKAAIAVGVKCNTKSGDSWTVKVQLGELEKSSGKIIDISGPAVKGNYEKKFKRQKPVKLGDTGAEMFLSGSVKPELTFKPNYEMIAEKVVSRTAADVAKEAIISAVDVAAAAGPPIVFGAIAAYSIYIVGEQGQRDAALLAGVKDARNSATAYALVMTGRGGKDPGGPISQEAAKRGRAELAKLAAANKVSVEEFEAALRAKTTSQDHERIRSQAEANAKADYHEMVKQSIIAWRKEHYIAKLFNREDWEIESCWKKIEMVWT
jgi:hypothetical protein